MSTNVMRRSRLFVSVGDPSQLSELLTDNLHEKGTER